MSKHLLYIVTPWCCCSRGLLLVRLVSVGLLTGSLLLCGPHAAIPLLASELVRCCLSLR